jgi:hypothetical protein
MFTTEYLKAHTPTGTDLRAICEETGCGINQSYTIARQRALLWGATNATTLDELRDVVIEMLTPQRPRG